MFDPRRPTGGDFVLMILWLYWMVACVTFQWRNPTANPLTCLSRFHHCVQFDKLAEFQVVKTTQGI